MEKITLPLLLLIALLSLTSKPHSAMAKGPNTPLGFIKSSCMVTRYPSLCFQSLSPFAGIIQRSPKQMAQTALTVSLSNAKSSKAFVVQMSKLWRGFEYQVLKDCIENMGDSVDRISQSIAELRQMGQTKEEGFLWHMSNVQTWVSAALTDVDTCMDGFAGRFVDNKLKIAIRSRITPVARLTSNALALVNLYANN